MHCHRNFTGLRALTGVPAPPTRQLELGRADVQSKRRCLTAHAEAESTERVADKVRVDVRVWHGRQQADGHKQRARCGGGDRLAQRPLEAGSVPGIVIFIEQGHDSGREAEHDKEDSRTRTTWCGCLGRGEGGSHDESHRHQQRRPGERAGRVKDDGDGEDAKADIAAKVEREAGLEADTFVVPRCEVLPVLV
eukprot:3115123-Prymnesium_polylepis.2